MIWTGETGGAIRLINMGPHALPVLPAMEEAARTTSATKVCVWEIEKDRVRKPEEKYAYYSLFLWLYLKMTAPTLHKRKRKKTTSSSRRPPALHRSPGLGPPSLILPVSPPRPQPSPPQRTCRRMKWSTHSRCVSCHLTVFSGSSFISKLGGVGSGLGFGGAQSSKKYRIIYKREKKIGSKPNILVLKKQ